MSYELGQNVNIAVYFNAVDFINLENNKFIFFTYNL